MTRLDLKPTSKPVKDYYAGLAEFDKHGITCSVCFDIAIKTKQMHEQGIDICTIRKEIDKFYEPNKQLGTETPMPEGCEV